VPNESRFANFAQNHKKGSNKYGPFGKKVVIIGLLDPEILWIKFKNKKKRNA